MRLLDPSQIDCFQRDGFLLTGRKVISDAEMPGLRERVTRDIERFFPNGKSGTAYALQRFDSCYIELAKKKEILDVVESVLGPDIGFFTCNLFIKQPKTPQHVQWHTDARTYQTLRLFVPEADFVGMLIAITPSTIGNGCVSYLPGTHKKRTRDYKNDPYQNCLFGELGFSGVRDCEVEAPETAVPLEMEPGYCSIHDAHVIHGSEPNQSEVPRILLNLKFFPTRLKYDQEAQRRAYQVQHDTYLIRGRDLAGSCLHSLV